MRSDTPKAVQSHEPSERQRLYSIASAARILGLTETVLRAQIFRGNVRVVRLSPDGRRGRTFISCDEFDRLTGR
jgi:hypothetical protein